MSVRPLNEDDLPQVADLYWTVLRERKPPVPPVVQSHLRNLYFNNPWRDRTIPSLVYDAGAGNIIGFLGVVPRRMSMRGRSIRIAFGGNFVVRPESRMSLAGIHLLRTYMAGEQDLSQTDSANDISRALLMRLGFKTILPFSIHWVRPLRPAKYAVYTLSRQMGRVLSAGVRLAAKPGCSAFDSISAKASSSPFRQIVPRLESVQLDAEVLLRCLSDFRNGYSLWPEYDSRSLEWLLTFMEQMGAHGRLRRLALRDRTGKTVGWYVYYRNPGSVAEVVQIGGAQAFIKDVLDHLFHDAWSDGAIAIQGVVNSQLMPEFSDKNCIFTCRGGWTVAYSRDPELLETMERGDAFLSRLDGEWCLGVG